MKSFWEDLPTPFTILAPMEGVTDVVFRQIITKIGKPDVFITEFTNCDGLMSKGREKVAQSLKFDKNEEPIVAQIWVITPGTFYESAKYCKELGFSGIDINMGCPVSTVVKKGACAGLIKNPSLAKEIIQATSEGASGLPVSVKTRLGYEVSQIEEWIGFLLKQDLAALSIHLRTVSELSKVPAHWEYIPKIIQLRNKLSPKTLVIGNGDIMTYSEGLKKYKKFGCEGLMIGRGIFTNPWLFNTSIKLEDITEEMRLDLYIQHIKLFDKTWGMTKNPASLKKFNKTYITSFTDATGLRERVVRAKNTKEMIDIIMSFKKNLGIVKN